MEFLNPYYLILGILSIIAWTFGYFKVFKQPELRLPDKAGAKRILWRRALTYLLSVAGLCFLTYSLMGPRRPSGFQPNTIEANDLYLVFDVSRSMLAEDFKPNRLEAAKKIMSEFVDMRPHDRLGLIMFSERVYTQLPLTTDYDLVKKMIAEIDIGFLGSGTNIGDALGLGVARLNQSLAKNRIIILLTDGVSNVGTLNPLQAAEMASKAGVKIYTIGMGTEGEVQIPIPGTYFGRRRYQTIPGGSIDGESLQKIAEITKAKYFFATSEQALVNVFKEIESLERSEVEVSSQVIYEELYYQYLVLGFILLFGSEAMRRFLWKEVS